MLARTSIRQLTYPSRPGRKFALCGLALLLIDCFAPVLAQGPGALTNPAQAQTAPEQTGVEPVILAVQLNGALVSSGAQLWRSSSGIPLLPANALQSWHLRSPQGMPVNVDGEDYYPITLFHLASYRIDSATQTLYIEAEPDAFESTHVDASAIQLQRPTPASPGVFLNYDLYTQHDDRESQEGGLFQIGAFNRYGVGIADWLSRYGGEDAGTVRLDTMWRSDFPLRMTSLTVGDFISRPGNWGAAARMGGIQYGTNFATQPRFVTTPFYTIEGQAALPSVVDVYVNNVLASRSEVQPGPFAIGNLPVLNGSGEISTVVTDLLGRQKVITQPFFSSTSLLREGLSDFSFELGGLRQNYGVRSTDYGPAALVGTWRHGLSNRLTAEIHGEIEEERAAAGLSSAWLFNPLGIFSGSLAMSRNPDIESEQGTLAALGFERLTPGLSVAASTQWATSGFTQLGYSLEVRRLHRQTHLTISQGFGLAGTLAASFVSQKYFDTESTRIAQLSYNLGLRRWGYVSATALQTISPTHNTQAGLFWTIPLGTRTSASLSAQSDRQSSDPTQWTASVQQNLPAGEGWGYFARASQNGNGYLQGQYQGRVGTYTAQVQWLNGESSSRLEAAGGMGWLGGHPFLSRTMRDSFALVEVPGIEDVQIYAENQPIGRTNSHGQLIIPQLLSYVRSTISVEQGDLPLDARIEALSLPLAPPYRSGVILQFPIQVARSATFGLILNDGSAVPAGAQMRLFGRMEGFPVGMQGRAYLSDLSDRNEVHVKWPGGECRFVLEVLPSEDPLPDLGIQVCESTTR